MSATGGLEWLENRWSRTCECRWDVVVAIANIQRLTLDNHQLRQQLHAATKVTHINTRPRS